MPTMKAPRPWLNPDDGRYYLRTRVPADLVAVAGKTIHKVGLGTASREEAEAKWPAALADWATVKAGWQRRKNVKSLTRHDAEKIAATWATWIAGGAALERAGVSSDVMDADVAEALMGRTRVHSEEALRLAGIDVDPDSLALLHETMLPLVATAYLEAELREQEDRGTRLRRPLEAALSTLPPPGPLPALEPAKSASALSFKALYDGWKPTATTKGRTVEDTWRHLELLRAFLTHDDALRVTKDDIRRWRSALKERGLTNNTWNNRLSLVNQVFMWGVSEGKLKEAPTEGQRLAKSKGKERLPFDDEQAAAILKAARDAKRASVRWAHWIMAFSGMRVGEVLQLLTTDVRQEDGIWYLSVNEDDVGKSVKTSTRRHVPLHPALITEGFLEYFKKQPQGAPLFPDKRPDKFGQRGGDAWKVTGRFVRATVGITDPRFAPDHSWRHRLEDQLRDVEAPEDVRDAIAGHARRTTGRSYGVKGEALKRLYRYLEKVPVPPGLQGPV